eukprot:1157241-Pelagomonas_calceolata.AAC.7
MQRMSLALPASDQKATGKLRAIKQAHEKTSKENQDIDTTPMVPEPKDDILAQDHNMKYLLAG